MLAVAILDFCQKRSYYIYDTMLDVFLGVENMYVAFPLKNLAVKNIYRLVCLASGLGRGHLLKTTGGVTTVMAVLIKNRRRV